MPRVRKIYRNPAESRNYYLVDACFLANRYIPADRVPAGRQRRRIQDCMAWWREINAQLIAGHARLYVPDICIAEAFKTLAKKYYEEHWFSSATDLNNARLRFRKDVCLSARELRSARRHIRVHDISTNRDIILAVDRFYELFSKYQLRVSLPDLVILATAKYLLDFYDLPKSSTQIVTMDKALWDGAKRLSEIPHVYDPTRVTDAASRVFADTPERT